MLDGLKPYPAYRESGVPWLGKVPVHWEIAPTASAFRESGRSDDYFIRTNVDGTRSVMTAAAEQGARRFVFCGTAGIYGSRVPGVIDESELDKRINELRPNANV